MMTAIILLLALAVTADAYIVFDTSCTTPNGTANGTANFVRSPDSRGTLDILWSCLFTIIACTWTVQHLNVPEQRNGRDPGWKGDIKWKLKRLWTGLKWMLATMIAPELCLAKTAGDLRSGMKGLPNLREFARRDGVDWTLTHSLFADMGGFVIIGQTGRGPESSDSSRLRTDSVRIPGNFLIPPPYGVSTGTEETELQGLLPTKIRSRKPGLHYQNPFHLTATGIYRLRKSGLLSKLPSLTVDEINDKSKSDAFVRILSLVQIAWIVAQVAFRGSKSLAVSQLEIAVVAFSTCAIIIYALNWSKPKSVSVPYVIMSFPGDIPQEFVETVLDQGKDLLGIPFVAGMLGLERPFRRRILGSPIPNDWDTDQDSSLGSLCIIFGTAVFGGLHLAAWNFHFPTAIESTLWRATSLYCTVYGFGLIIAGMISVTLHGHDWTYRFSLAALTIIYILARLFLLVEIFRTLCFLPPGAYKSTWATNMPHLA